MIHEPLAYRSSCEWRKVLAGGRVRSRRSNDDGVRHGSGFLENSNDPCDIRLLLTNGHVDAVERAIVLVAGNFSRAVETSLADDSVNTNRRLACRSVANDQFALAAADRNHRVNGHDPRLHRLTDRSAPDDTGSHSFDRIGDVTLQRPFAVHRLSQRIHNAA